MVIYNLFRKRHGVMAGISKLRAVLAAVGRPIRDNARKVLCNTLRQPLGGRSLYSEIQADNDFPDIQVLRHPGVGIVDLRHVIHGINRRF